MEMVMKINLNEPPRKFQVGSDYKITIKDCGSITLDPDEQITFTAKDGKEYDVVKKEWGYYATPSVNGRLKKFGYKTALVKNIEGMIYVMIVDKEKIDLFQEYINNSNQKILDWLDEKQTKGLEK